MSRLALVLGGLLGGLTGCLAREDIVSRLDNTERTLALASKVYAPMCAPKELALAQSAWDFARIELYEGDFPRAQEHAEVAETMAVAALERATPCGGADRDRDTVADVVDDCPDEPEDLDGDEDDDGCRETDPVGDEDKDDIPNFDDGCIDVPEDRDGDRDEDGCPETSDDGDGDGIIDVLDTCPDEPEDLDQYRDADGCPDGDNDADLLADFRDACPMSAEDRDGWEDDDGCPDPDNDGDGIPDGYDLCRNEVGDRDHAGCPARDADQDGVSDENDACPTEPETPNAYLDEDGCPDVPPNLVTVTREQVEIKEIILFETGSARLLAESDRVLEDVARVLSDAPKMRLRIEGHTDAEGSEAFNLELSRERAISVRAWLVAHGVSEARLTAEGFGETRPIDTNRTPAGRATNRRVEFHIVRD